MTVQRVPGLSVVAWHEAVERGLRADGKRYLRAHGRGVSARCHGGQANFLALNLMNDVVTGAKSVQEAREDHAKEFADLPPDEAHGVQRGASLGFRRRRSDVGILSNDNSSGPRRKVKGVPAAEPAARMRLDRDRVSPHSLGHASG